MSVLPHSVSSPSSDTSGIGYATAAILGSRSYDDCFVMTLPDRFADKISSLETDVGELVRETYDSMKADKEGRLGDWEWYDPMTTEYMRQEDKPYSVAETYVQDLFLDSYLHFKSKFEGMNWKDEEQMKESVVWYSLCTTAHDVLPSGSDNQLQVYND